MLAVGWDTENADRAVERKAGPVRPTAGEVHHGPDDWDTIGADWRCLGVFARSCFGTITMRYI